MPSPFTFNTTVPAANDFPGDDQPFMLTNNISTNDLIAVDHVKFNSTDGGKHQQITFVNKNTPVGQTDPQSVLFTGSGTASTVSQLQFAITNATIPISAVRAFVVFANAPGTPAITLLNSFNVVSVTNATAASIQTYTITLTPNCTTGNNAVVLVSLSDNSASVNTLPPSAAGRPYIYTFTGGVITLTISKTTATQAFNINIAVLQF